MAEQKRLQIVTFQLGEEKYGIDIMDVKEIVRLQEIRHIPNTPPYVQGILNLRGAIIPVINLHQRFRLKKAELSSEDELLRGIVILEVDKMILGVIIDQVSRVISMEASKIQPPPQMVSGIGSEYIQGVIRDEEKYIIILNIRKLFNPKELQQISVVSS